MQLSSLSSFAILEKTAAAVSFRHIDNQHTGWYRCWMDGTRKITVEVSESLLDKAQAETGKGVTDTVREGLKKLASARAQKELLALRGKVKFSMTWQEMKEDLE